MPPAGDRDALDAATCLDPGCHWHTPLALAPLPTNVLFGALHKETPSPDHVCILCLRLGLGLLRHRAGDSAQPPCGQLSTRAGHRVAHRGLYCAYLSYCFREVPPTSLDACM